MINAARNRNSTELLRKDLNAERPPRRSSTRTIYKKKSTKLPLR